MAAGHSRDLLDDDDDTGLVINSSKFRETSYGTSSLSSQAVVDTSDLVKSHFVIGFMGLLGLALVYAMRVNLCVAIVALVNNKQPEVNVSSDVCRLLPEPGPASPLACLREFDWDERTQRLIPSSFFYGYVLTKVPGGRLAKQYGGKQVFGLGIFFFTALFTILSPIAARMGEGVFITIRVPEGLGLYMN